MPAERSLRLAIGALALIGLAIAAYIAISEAGGGSPVCLAGSGGCDTVAQSEFSELAGTNVAVIGIAGYLAIAASALLRGDLARFAGMALGVVGLGFSAYLTYLELFVIDAICQWCVASAVVMAALAAVTAARALGHGGT